MSKRPKWADPFITIDTALKESGESLSRKGFHGDGRVHKNRDHSVDGELRVRVLQGKRVALKQIFLEILMTLQKRKELREAGFWLSFGLRYRPREAEPYYRKWQGMSQVEIFPQRAKKMIFNYLTMTAAKVSYIGKDGKTHYRKGVLAVLKAKGRRNAEVIFVRLHWNRNDDKPRRK